MAAGNKGRNTFWKLGILSSNQGVLNRSTVSNNVHTVIPRFTGGPSHTATATITERKVTDTGIDVEVSDQKRMIISFIFFFSEVAII